MSGSVIKKVRKPRNLAYGVDEAPPLSITILSGLQHCAILVFTMFTALIICRAANASLVQTVNTLSIGLLVSGVGTVLQANRMGPIGSGYLVPNGSQAAFLGPSIVAAKLGGLPLVFGMTILSGLVQVVISRFWNRLRPLLPPEMSGLVVILIGMQIATVGLRALIAPASGLAPTLGDWAVAGFTLAAIIILNIWSKGSMRLFCVLLGLFLGYGLAIFIGVGSREALAAVAGMPPMALPSIANLSWSFDSSLVLPFLIVGLATAMGTSANITVAQKMNDADWVRPDFDSVSRGTLTDGIVASSAGLFGACGVGTIATNIGVMVATGVTSRRIAYSFGVAAIMLAFVPQFSAALAATPPPVLGASLLFASAFTMMSGLQIITSRLIDARKTIVIGLSIWTALAVFIYPDLGRHLPDALRSLAASALVAGAMVGLLLTAIFRLGLRKQVRLDIEPDREFVQAIEDFAQSNGAAWGARADVIQRAQFGITQTTEAVIENCDPKGPIAIVANFDEFSLDVDITYDGELLELVETRPSDEEIIEAEDGIRRLAGFMLRRNADRVEVAGQNGSSRIRLHFDH